MADITAQQPNEEATTVTSPNAASAAPHVTAATAPTTITVHNSKSGKAISTDLWGIFLEDINYSIDGGLNADLVQNGAFAYNRADNPRWSHLFTWTIDYPRAAARDVSVRTDHPVAAENPHYMAAQLGASADDTDSADTVTLINRGFDGMTFAAGTRYACTAWVRAEGADMTIAAELIDEATQADDGGAAVLAHAEMSINAHGASEDHDEDHNHAVNTPTVHGWQRLAVTLDCTGSTTQGALRFTVSRAGDISTSNSTSNAATAAIAATISIPAAAPATFSIDWVTLRPCNADGTPRLFRDDMVRALHDLAPRFMRFPGGCITHGVETSNIYRWKRTIGPVEHRPHQYSYWGYHQSFTVGFHEYFLLCEAIGAKPLPVLPVGVSCQNTAGGVTVVPMDQMTEFVQDALDLIEYANGPVTSTWGAKRAAAGHPKPFGLEYLGLGNEDKINDAFRERFSLIYDAVKRAYPNITVIGTAGPNPSGEDYDAGWDFARRKPIDMVDEHAYKSPQWWFAHLDHYDGRDPLGPATYLGEYGSWSNLQISALAEAAIMTSIERNGDTVRMASYAPLFGRLAHTQWHPDLLYFDSERTIPTLNYWVQRMYARSAMTHVLDTTVRNEPRFEPEPRNWTGLRFGSVDAGSFVFSDISVTVLDANDATSANDASVANDSDTAAPSIVHAPDTTLRGSGASVDTGLHVTADHYRIAFTARRTDGEDGLIIDFGAVDSSDYFRWAFGDWDNKYYILKRVGDGIPDEAVPAVEGGVESNRDYRVEIEVANQGQHVQVWLNGQRIHEYRDTSEQNRFVVSAGRNTTAGALTIRIVNATDQPQPVEFTFDQSPLTGSAHGTATTLAAARDAGKPFEEAPARPQTVDVSAADLAHWKAEPYSFTVLTLPEQPEQ
ncbi:Alpha-L-arabinofuranosidase C-terminal domain-containing protein [Bifidobacterium goeldii]|uniref:non-reducing end alpha-L-arabinofuranosidase n=1 Tax=Bifidobacterium goeldii TaxID=2306975 RepID=A0A430FGW2_9BIFI|nr:alpha-L-arabinofuranosidase C-terminal domain-containing protein [Bifidobacterium goeldii]RSX52135.1 Alpha-L-arabinofuranosidase C-terminal domain-containing protein [Bifidobacterium goeldii]